MPNRRTSSGSSAASSTASASSPTAPTGRLELVADVGHEVAPGRLQPHGLGRVAGLDQRVAVAERPHPGEHGGGSAAAVVERREVDRDRRAALAAPRWQAATARASGSPSTHDAELAARALCSTTPSPRSSTTSPASVERNDALQEVATAAGRGRHGRPAVTPPPVAAAPPAPTSDAEPRGPAAAISTQATAVTPPW